MRRVASFLTVALVAIIVGFVTVGCSVYILTLTINGNGTVSPNGRFHEANSTVTLTATPDSGWQFTGWSGNASGSDPIIDVVMDSNKTIVANFSEIASTNYTLTVYTNGSGTVSPAGGSYPEGTTVTLTATPSSGWEFLSWAGAASGSNTSVSVTMTGDLSVTANFQEDTTTTFSDNWPVTGDLGVHDPTIIRDGSTYYIFSTGIGIPIKRSYDGLEWSDIGTVFGSYPSWASTYVPDHEDNIWAPDISFYNGTYYLYYAISSFGSNTSAIGLATTTSLSSGSWVDQGLVIRSTSSNDYNCIDPNMVVDQSGRVWLAFGSFWTGLKIVELDTTTMKPQSGATIYSLGTRDNTAIEAPSIVYRNGYYYLFASIDYCCQGVDSDLKIIYGRSSSITGPYYDKNGVSMMNGGGSLFDAGNVRWKGPGGQSLLGTKAICHHAYDADNDGAATLMIKNLYWDDDGWPYKGDDVTDSSDGLVGFATVSADGLSGTTGGEGGTTVTVTSSSAFLNYIQASGSYIVQVSGTINISGMNTVASNKTIIGLGSSAVVSGGGLNLSGVSNIIIQNIHFTNAGDDSINVQESSHHIWIDHCDFSNGYDGLIDIKRESSYITVSWNHFYNHSKTCLLGHSDDHTEDIGNLKVSYHHNWFDNTDSRHPRVRFGHVHVFNNYYVGNEYGIASTMDADVLVEGNYFYNVESPTHVGYAASDVGDLVERYNVYVNCDNDPETRGSVDEFSYSYSLDNASSIPSIVQSGAGVGNM